MIPEDAARVSAAGYATLDNRQVAELVINEGFNLGNVEMLPQLVKSAAQDHQDPDAPDFVAHLSAVIVAMRTAFPDLHFAIDQIFGEGEWVAMHSVMTGTHLGPLQPPLLPPDGPPSIPATGRTVRVAHMHMIRNEGGKGVELFHLMDTFGMMKQLGLLPGPPPRA